MAQLLCTDRVRMLFFVKRKEGITREQFSKWSDTHAKLFLSLDVVKTNILKYEQALPTDEKWVSFSATALGVKVPDWDGVGIIDAASFEKIFEVFGSEDLQKAIGPDAVNFVDRENIQVVPVGVNVTA